MIKEQKEPVSTGESLKLFIFDLGMLIKRLTALLARPYGNLVRYHGVFANRSNERARLPLPPSLNPLPEPLPEPLPQATLSRRPQGPAEAPGLRFSSGVLHVDALTCPRYGEAMGAAAFLTDPAVVKKILDHFHLPSADPPCAPARVPLEQMTIEAELEEEFADDPFPSTPPPPRGPRETGLRLSTTFPSTNVRRAGRTVAKLCVQPPRVPVCVPSSHHPCLLTLSRTPGILP